jgi:hypothetical protein
VSEKGKRTEGARCFFAAMCKASWWKKKGRGEEGGGFDRESLEVMPTDLLHGCLGVALQLCPRPHCGRTSMLLVVRVREDANYAFAGLGHLCRDPVPHVHLPDVVTLLLVLLVLLVLLASFYSDLSFSSPSSLLSRCSFCPPPFLSSFDSSRLRRPSRWSRERVETR